MEISARRRCWRAEGVAVGEIFLGYQEDEQVGANELVVTTKPDLALCPQLARADMNSKGAASRLGP